MPAEKSKINGKARLIRDLKNGEFAPLYIISGEESYLKEYYLRELRQKVVDPAFADFNLIGAVCRAVDRSDRQLSGDV